MLIEITVPDRVTSWKNFEDYVMQSNQSAQTVSQAKGWKSINNGVTTGGLFWLGASRLSSRFAPTLVYRAGTSDLPFLQARFFFLEAINATWIHVVADSTNCEITTLFTYDGFRVKSQKIYGLFSQRSKGVAISWKLVVSVRVNLDALLQTNAVLWAKTQTIGTTIVLAVSTEIHAECIVNWAFGLGHHSELAATT